MPAKPETIADAEVRGAQAFAESFATVLDADIAQARDRLAELTADRSSLEEHIARLAALRAVMLEDAAEFVPSTASRNRAVPAPPEA